MINEILKDIFLYLFIGFAIGIIEAWNKKVWFVAWFLLLIGYILNAIMFPQEFTNSFSDFIWWRFLINIIVLVIGIKIGNKIYKDIWMKK